MHITLVSGGINVVEQGYLTRGFWVFLIRKVSGKVDVFCSIAAYMCGGEWSIIL